MKVFTQLPVDTPVMTDIICDSCGMSCNADTDLSARAFEYAEINVNWGYYSNNKDCERHEIVICEACYDKMLTLMNIKPKITTYL